MEKVSKLSDFNIDNLSKVLFFMPHPDDETVFSAILLTRLTNHNIPVRVVTLTRGEQSSRHYGLPDTKTLIEIRPRELKSALGILGVDNNNIYSIPDGKIQANKKRVAKIIEKEINSYEPTHIVTLEPNGIYGHPDHVYLSKLVKQICKPSQTLIYTTVSKYFKPSKGAVALSIKIKSNVRPIEPTHYISFSLKEMYLKLRAFQAHTSQFPLNPIHLPYLWKLICNRVLLLEYFSIG